MIRRAPLALLAPLAVVLAALGCDASVSDACFGGVCGQGGSGGSGTTSTTTGTGGSGGSEPPATGDFPCDIFAIIHKSCNPCHQDPPLNGAPFPILTYEDTQQPFGSKGKKRYQRMAEVIAPASGPFMPLQPNNVGVDPLDDATRDKLAAWLAAPTAEPEGMGCECPGQGCN
ncbi:MAG: hypothetical protein U0359_16660 [Byssovorax sp.]